ncbi:MAG: MtnX-like HAD-IB family phosphatase, partial [Candidatus Ranarchaeia archaeon]
FKLRFPGSKIIYIGDGETDKCPSQFVDYVYPKKGSPLHKFCAEKEIPHTPFSDFNEILKRIKT